VVRKGIGLPGNAEEMGAFFDARAIDYEEHMRTSVEEFDAFYTAAIEALPGKSTAPHVLDLGVGTGLELEGLFARFPEARVTGIDLSGAMLSRLRRKQRPWQQQLELVQESFLTYDFAGRSFDLVLSVMALHHWVPEIKARLYRRIHGALAPEGAFVNADYIESAEESAQLIGAFQSMGVPAEHQQHIDLPLTIAREQQILLDAGFMRVAVPYKKERTAVIVSTTM